MLNGGLWIAPNRLFSASAHVGSWPMAALRTVRPSAGCKLSPDERKSFIRQPMRHNTGTGMLGGRRRVAVCITSRRIAGVASKQPLWKFEWVNSGVKGVKGHL